MSIFICYEKKIKFGFKYKFSYLIYQLDIMKKIKKNFKKNQMKDIKIFLSKKKKGEQNKNLLIFEKQDLVEHRRNYVKMYEKTNSKYFN